ncbi:MAG: Ig-like domain-containing protein [Candidatus Thorarchaeota archaeon]
MSIRVVSMHRTVKRGAFVLLLGVTIMLGLLCVPSSPHRESSLVESVVVSDDYHSNHNIVIGINSYEAVSWTLDQGNGIYGEFQVTKPSSGDDQIITFFICDSENYDLYTSGETASVYHLQENVASYSFKFVVPKDDTWYFVFRNYALLTSKTVNLDLYMDLTPPSIDINLDAGATYSGIKEITATITEQTFDIKSVKLYIDNVLVDTEYDSSFSYSWNTESYTNGDHTIRIVAEDTVGNSGYEEVTVFVSNARTAGTTSVQSTGDTGDGGGVPAGVSFSSTIVIALGFVGLVVVVGVLAAAKHGGSSSGERLGVGEVEPARTVKEREIVTERVLVICPFCGTKNEQGTAKCTNCGAEL